MPGGFDQPSCPGERERQRERDSEGWAGRRPEGRMDDPYALQKERKIEGPWQLPCITALAKERDHGMTSRTAVRKRLVSRKTPQKNTESAGL